MTIASPVHLQAFEKLQTALDHVSHEVAARRALRGREQRLARALNAFRLSR